MDRVKRKALHWKILLGLLMLAGLVAVGPIIFYKLTAKPLQGCFKIGNCMGGHEMFILVEGTEAYDYCPGHRDKRLIGPVTRDQENVSFQYIRRKGKTELKFTDRGHQIRSVDPETEWTNIEQVSSPWRTWLPTLFPE